MHHYEGIKKIGVIAHCYNRRIINTRLLNYPDLKKNFFFPFVPHTINLLLFFLKIFHILSLALFLDGLN